MTRSLDQKRAAFALAKVQEVARLDCKSEYRSNARSMPALIIASGLGQALAVHFAGMTSKNDDVRGGHTQLYNHVKDWLVRDDGWGAASPYLNAENTQQNEPKLIHAIIGKSEADLIRAQGQVISGGTTLANSSSEADLIRAQYEVMAFLKWLKKFAEALIEAKADGEPDA